MSYILINGKRHYRDDETGEVSVDNVSQAAADQRELRNHHPVTRIVAGNFGTVAVNNPIRQLIEFINRSIRVIRMFLLAGLLVLITAYFIHDQPQVRNPFQIPSVCSEVRIQLRNTDDVEQQLQRVGEHINSIFTDERGKQ